MLADFTVSLRGDRNIATGSELRGGSIKVIDVVARIIHKGSI